MNLNENTNKLESPFSLFKSKDGICILKFQVTNRFNEIFKKNENKGFTGDGYDWCAIISVLVDSFDSKLSEHISLIPFTSDVFIMSDDKNIIKKVKSDIDRIYKKKEVFEYYLSHVDYI